MKPFQDTASKADNHAQHVLIVIAFLWPQRQEVAWCLPGDRPFRGRYVILEVDILEQMLAFCQLTGREEVPYIAKRLTELEGLDDWDTIDIFEL